MCGIAGILFKHAEDGLDLVDAVGTEPGVDRINEILTMHMGPRDVLLNLSLDFRSTLTSDQVEAEVARLERHIKAAFPEITRIFIEAEARRR